jgi:hypothetical protein
LRFWFSLHREGFTRSSLTISENRTIISLNNTLNDWKGCVIENIFLSRFLIVHIIECELSLGV